MRARTFTVHINGHPGHHGNVLAFAFLDRVKALLDALALAERNFLGVPFRQTDYEITDVEKVNPTQITLHPVPTAKNYDPIIALDWSFSQIERIAKGEPVDEKVDERLATALAKVVPKEHSEGATAVWISLADVKLKFDAEFKFRSEAVAALRRATTRKDAWVTTKSNGSVVGELLQVDDMDGKSEFAIQPAIGPNRIICAFSDEQREQMRQYLFRTVRVSGLLCYEKTSPFPSRVEMHHIEAVKPLGEGKHLLDMQGSFKGRERIKDEAGEAFNGL